MEMSEDSGFVWMLILLIIMGWGSEEPEELPEKRDDRDHNCGNIKN